ncbi:MAG: cupin domain-containing protein [Steroidobacteraceae bacterium]
MIIRKLDRTALGPDNGFSQPLMPWPALSAPFEGAWCVINPGSSSTRHAHHEYEIFIAVSGEATLESEGERTVFRAGDIVHFPPHNDHQVLNSGIDKFEMYAVWWDRKLAEQFAGRDKSAK